MIWWAVLTELMLVKLTMSQKKMLALSKTSGRVFSPILSFLMIGSGRSEPSSFSVFFFSSS